MPIPAIESRPILSKNLFPVVGIGASAGGLDAFKRLLSAIPVDSQMAWVIIQHLSADHESMLPELLQRYTPLPVQEIYDNLEVAPGHVFVIPHNKIVRASDGILQLFERADNERSSTIDIFFTSLAEIHREQTIGVILSGTGSDGTVGLKTIRDVGGLTIVQDKTSAAYYDMPQNAIDAGVVELILDPGQIPIQLVELVSRLHSPSQENSASQEKTNEEVFRQILFLLRSRKGVDFAYYRQSTIRRRIVRRQAIAHINTIHDYYQFLLDNKAEQENLFRDMLIPVTAFFRDPATFNVLCEQVFPELIANRNNGEPVRIWIAGCSTGEEAYSMAICMYEFLEDKNAFTKVQIFATDLSENVIAQARMGSYTKAGLAGVSPQRIQQFFTFSNGRYHVNKFIREMCVFAAQNFLKDPPFARMDLISCRNVFIYMEPVLQKKALLTFHYALRDKGILLLGRSETVAQANEQFQPLEGVEKLYRRKNMPAVFMQVLNYRDEQSYRQKNTSNTAKERPIDELTAASDQALIQWLNPVGVVINEQFDIVQFRGSTGDYLTSPAGKVSHNVLKMARDGLGFELRSALAQARTTGLAVTKNDILIDNGTRSVNIRILPLNDMPDPHYFVGFSDNDFTLTNAQRHDELQQTGQQPPSSTRIQQLEKELMQLREDIRSVTQDQEAVNEELQSANEELLSGSEELQSINEELQTTKEEVQSTNEELTTLNEELIVRNDQLADARSYAEAIVSTVHEPLVVLTADMRVRSANAAFYKEFNLLPKNTEGELFFELSEGKWASQSLIDQLQNVLPLHKVIEDVELNWSNGSSPIIKLVNARQLVDESRQEQLILLAIRDISERKALENQQAFQAKRLESMIMQSPAFAATLIGPEFTFGIINNSFSELFNGKPRAGDRLDEDLPELSSQGMLEQIRHVYTKGTTYIGIEIGYQFTSALSVKNIHLNYSLQPIHNERQEINGVLIIGYDATMQVRAKKERELQLRHILESTHVISWIADLDGELSFLNERFYTYTGLRKEDPITWNAFIHHDHEKRVADLWKTAIKDRAAFHWEGPIKTADGVYRWHVHKAVFTPGDNGIPDQWIGTSIDIHEQKVFSEELARQVGDRTQELQQANEQLQQSNIHLKQFASIASHDLQEPLRKIMIFTGVLNRQYSRLLPPEGQQVISKIKMSAERMSQLIRETLEYSRVLHATDHFAPVNLDTIMKKVIGDLDLLLSETVGSIDYPIPLPTINAVSLQMNQLFYNLMTNALKFYKELEHPAISITHQLIKAEALPKTLGPTAYETYLEIIVADNGIGFRQEYADQIFELFERLHSHEEFEGTGIGLALCKQIVTNHHGFIYAISEAGKGARFHVLLPPGI